MSQLLNNICFNERQDIWTTKYDWTPTVSENINGTYFSIGGSNDDAEFNNRIWSHKVIDSDPTRWFDQQHPFEFEFVVNEPQGVHKIIENLQILSNNVQPEQLTFEIIGDSYQFNKERISHLGRAEENIFGDRINSSITNKDGVVPSKTENFVSKNTLEFTETESPIFDENKKLLFPWIKNISKIKHFTKLDWDDTVETVTYIKKDKRTGQCHFVIPQECRNIETFGRRLGNIHYKEDSWYTNVEPIIYDPRINDLRVTKEELKQKPNLERKVEYNSTRIRDKWCKIKVRYTGEDLAIITAIRTIMNV